MPGPFPLTAGPRTLGSSYPRLLLLTLAVALTVPSSSCSADDLEEPPRIITPRGTFIGRHMASARQQRPVFAFTGIPYASPPIHHLRFASPVPPPSQTEPYDASRPSPECIQWDHLRLRGMVGQEDCLYLDIYTNGYSGMKDRKKMSNQPVVAFLHAGSWLAGGGAQDLFSPDYLIENDVVVVNLNHRLGALGFLSTEDKDGPGNYAMRDTIFALEWIRDNIWFFGGMNESVTVMGSGAGGTTAHFLTLSPLARGASLDFDEYSLLARAISQSGTAYTPHAISRDAKQQARALAVAVGCPSNVASSDLINCLRTIKASDLVGRTPNLFKWDEEPLPFGPVIDGPWMGDQAFLPDEPFHLIHQKKVLNIPWMAGTNRDDGAFRVRDILQDSHLVKQLNSEWDKWGPVLLHLTKESCKDPVAISRQIRDYYMKGDKFGDASSKKFVEMVTDRFFVYPTDKAMTDHCSVISGERTWCYRYVLDYCGRKSFLDTLEQETKAAAVKSTFGMGNPRFQNTRDAHGWGVGFLDELLYLFPSPKLNLVYTAKMDNDGASSVSTNMIMSWTNFIKGGDPTPVMDGMTDEFSPWGYWWEPYYVGYDYYLKIDPEMETQDVPYRNDQRHFWNSLPLFENRDHNVIRDEL